MLLAPLTNATIDGQQINFNLQCTIARPPNTIQEIEFTDLWIPPADWDTFEPVLHVFDNGNGRTFDPETFAQDDTIGLRIARYGSQPDDNFSFGLKIAEAAFFLYNHRYFEP